MALAFGGGVRPELGRTDYGAVARGSEIAAQLSAQGSQMMASGLSSGIQSIAKGIDEMQQMKAQTQAATALGKTLQKHGAKFGLPQEVIGMAQSSVEQLESPDLTLRAKSVLGKQMTSLFGGVVQMGIEGAVKQQTQLAQQLVKVQNAITLAQELYPGDARAVAMAQADPEGFMALASKTLEPATIGAGATRTSPFGESTAIETSEIQTLRKRAEEAGHEKGSREYNAFMASGGNATSKDTAAEQKIERLMVLGFNRLDAIAVVDGVKRIETDPVTGRLYIVDMQSGQATPVREVADKPQAPLPELTPGDSLYEIGQKVTGIGPSLLAATQRVVGLGSQALGLDGKIPGSEEVIAGRQYIDASMQELVRSLSINPRFPVAEMERIRKEVNISPSTFMDPETLGSRMRGIDKSLRARLVSEERAAYNQSLPAQDRANALAAADNIRRFLNILGADKIPDSASGGEWEIVK
jgi:hypothetical protein